MGAIGEDGVQVMDDDVLRGCGVGPGEVARVERRERAELERRLERLRGARRPVSLAGRTVIIVDDGVATGSSMLAAIASVRARHPQRLVVAIGVAPRDTLTRLEAVADEVVCLYAPDEFYAVGAFFQDFSEVTDDMVVAALSRPARELTAPH
jgi:putative phosphoribosyl transferase